ncbi:MAG: DUF502 domain-containing protein [Candidatus Omnitrophota bacterium]|nr:DUF502 domain-containing protein [Candidatus Omnitrophota bacterium]
MIAQIRKYFVAGLLTILPLALSVYILLVLFRIVDGILGRYLNVYIKSLLGFYIPGLGLILFLTIIFLSGILSIHFFGARLHLFLGRALGRFPLLKYIYPSVKKVFEFVFSDNKLGFKKVVLVEYPSKGIWSMGFIANDGFAEAEAKTGKKFYNIYIPSVPNPTTGFFFFIPKDEVVMLDIGIKEAMRLVMSGGLLNPSDFIKDTKSIGV